MHAAMQTTGNDADDANTDNNTAEDNADNDADLDADNNAMMQRMDNMQTTTPQYRQQAIIQTTTLQGRQ
jgi:hypothetical protein